MNKIISQPKFVCQDTLSALPKSCTAH